MFDSISRADECIGPSVGNLCQEMSSDNTLRLRIQLGITSVQVPICHPSSYTDRVYPKLHSMPFCWGKPQEENNRSLLSPYLRGKVLNHQMDFSTPPLLNLSRVVVSLFKHANQQMKEARSLYPESSFCH